MVVSSSSASPAGPGAPILDTLAFAVTLDILRLPAEGLPMANLSYATTGLVPLVVGSIERLQFAAMLGGIFWDLTGGMATLLLADPNGQPYSFTASISGGGGYYDWPVAGPTGTWTRAWKLLDAQGRVQQSRPIAFGVITSP